MQRYFDYIYNILYRVACICLYIFFCYILWCPFISFFYCYEGFKKNLKKFLKCLDFEFFVREERLMIIIIARAYIDIFLFIFCSIPWCFYSELVKKPIIKRFANWCKINPGMHKTLKNYFTYKVKVFIHLCNILYKYICKVYLFIKIILLDFFFHDVFQKRKIIHKHFVIVRTKITKIVLFYLIISNYYFDWLYDFYFCTCLGIEYNYWNFDSMFIYFYFLTFIFNFNKLCILLKLLILSNFEKSYLLNVDEQLIYLNLNKIPKYFYSSNEKIFLWDVVTDYHFDYTNTPIFYIAGFLFFSLILISWFFFSCLAFQAVFKRSLICLLFFLIPLYYHKTIYKLYIWNIIIVYQYDYTSIPIFFFLGFLFFTTVMISWLFFSFLGLYGLFKLNLISLFIFWISLLFYIKPVFLLGKVYEIKILNWFYLSNNTIVDYYFLIDSISFSFILLTTTIALFVYIYAFSYFRYEPLVDRFLLFLLSFVVSMLFLVSSGNLIMLYLGWELIGLTSFFLINFWTTKTSTLKSSFKAFSFNKVSDFFLFIFIISMYNIYFTLDILTLNNIIYKNQYNFVCFGGYSISSLEFLGFTLLIAAFIKSAQIGGHIWLPDSMEAPVPASALIHSATLVSAGIYLILRFNFLFDYSHIFKIVVPLLGSITAAYGGICAVLQTDLKKTLAYSTISHCGFLVILCSTEVNEFVILYLYTHGFFKAILFMCVGNVLRVSVGYQDSRRMGGLFKYLPFEYFCSLICIFNLAGLPFTFGFFAKHLLFLNLGEYVYLYYFVIFNSFLGAIFGLFYSFNILYSVFFDFKKGNKSLYKHLNSKKSFSIFYTNSSVASTISILLLFLIAYMLIFYLYLNMVSTNFLFSDCINTTINSNYYSFLNLNLGFNMNYFYINCIILIFSIYLFLKKKRKSMYIYTQFNLCFSLLLTISLFMFMLI